MGVFESAEYGAFYIRPSTLDAKVWITRHFRDANINHLENEVLCDSLEELSGA